MVVSVGGFVVNLIGIFVFHHGGGEGGGGAGSNNIILSIKTTGILMEGMGTLTEVMNRVTLTDLTARSCMVQTILQ